MMNLWSNVSKVVTSRTYLRNDNGKYENWEDLIHRVVAGNNPLTKEEADELSYMMRHRKAMPAGRGLWFSGAPAHAKLGGAALNNCWFTTAEEIENFVMAQDLLMLGGGVGFSVEHKFVSKLPKVKKDVIIQHKNTKDADFIVPDSRSGWNELTRRMLESFFVTGKSFSYSTVCLRAYGEPIQGFGGKSSGAQPLIDFVEKVCNILKQREGKHIKTLDASDILCCIGEFVVSGNVRRSAIIILGDAWDKEYLKAKRWDLGILPSYRAMANFSVVVEDMEDVHPLFWKTYEHGEAFGIFNRKNAQTYGRMGEKKKDTGIGINPCQPAFAKLSLANGNETTMGELKIGDVLLNKDNKETIVTNKQSTGIQHVFAYASYDATFVGTTEHKVVTEKGKKEIGICFSNNIKILTIHGLQPIRHAIYLGEYEVFDITVSDDTHTYLTNGVYVSNCGESVLEDGEPCNLLEVFLPNLKDEEEFIKAAKLMFRYGKRVTLENYHNEKNNEVIKRNRRIGIGITGCLQSDLFNAKILDNVYNEIQKENKRYSKELDVEESIRTTVIKPSGTLSLLGDVTPGIHPAFSRNYIRRIRFSANDRLIPILKAAGHHIEPVQKFDGTLDHTTLVVDFYCEADAKTPCADEGFDTWKQLDTLLFAQKHWADQAVSVTVYYKREEIPQLKIWLNDNLKYLKTISFLCHNDHGFKQAPLEKITKEEYTKLNSNVKEINVDNVGSGDELVDTECEGGSCPIK